MAQAIRYICNHCQHDIEAWSDGNPYYLDDTGTKQYAYHPDHEQLARCIGNDSPYLCLSCGYDFLRDSLVPVNNCPECASQALISTYQLEGKACPYCKRGQFMRDPNFVCIS